MEIRLEILWDISVINVLTKAAFAHMPYSDGSEAVINSASA